MSLSRRAFLSAAAATLMVACSKLSATGGPVAGESNTLVVTGQFSPVAIESVERVSIDNGRLVLHGASTTATVDLPTSTDTSQANRGWTLVTEGEDGDVRSLTFTHEMSLDDFTLELPNSPAPLKYGSFAGRDGHDLLVFAWGAASKSYWGWVRIERKRGI
jgi:hypothetical protein